MKVKKIAALLLAGLMTFSMGSFAAAEDVTVETIYGSVEISGTPERVCVLDISALDVMDTLGLGEYVTTVMHKKNMPTYLEEYYNSDSIIVLQRERNNKGNDGNKSEESEGETSTERETEKQTEETETTDPYELYYSIDADLIIATAETVDEELYSILSQIAPTVVLGYAMDHEEGMYAGVKANARTIASIWGVEDKLDELTVEYDTIYQELDEKLEGVSAVLMNSAMDIGRLQVVTPIEEDEEASKTETEKDGLMLQELGMNMISNEAPEEIVTASTYEKNAEADVLAEKGQVIAAWVEEVNPDYVVLVDRSFDSIKEANAEGYSCAELEGLTVYQEGRICQLPIDGNNGVGGLHATFLQLDELKAFFLE